MFRLVRAAACTAALGLPAVAMAQPVPAARLSVSTAGAEGNGPSVVVAVSSDGRTVLFWSLASTLVAGDTNGQADLFIRDRDTDRDGILDEPGAVRTLRVNEGLAGQQTSEGYVSARLSADGRFVLFMTPQPLMAEDTNGVLDAYVRDRDPDADGIFDEAGAVLLERVSTGTDGTQANAASTPHHMTPDGRFVTFITRATNLYDRPVGSSQIYRKDRLTGITTIITALPDGTPSDSSPQGAVISDDGRYAAFAGGAFPATALPPGGWVIRDLTQNTFVPIPRPAAPASTLPVGGRVTAAIDVDFTVAIDFSADGQHLFLGSGVTAFVGGKVTATGTLYHYDVAAGAIVRHFPGVASTSPVPVGLPALDMPLGLIYTRAGSDVDCPASEGFGRYRYDIRTRRVTQLVDGRVGRPASTPDGRRLLYEDLGCQPGSAPRTTYLWDAAYDTPLPMPDPVRAGWMDAAGTTAIFDSREPGLLPFGVDTNFVDDVYAVDLVSRLDRDGDALDDRWEVAMGLDYTSGAGVNGAAGDPDADGVSNQQERAAGTHPRGSAREFLAEGADNAFFKTRLAIANPGTTPATAVVRLDGDDGSTTTINVNVPAGARRTVLVDEHAGHAPSFATTVESSTTLVSERTMSWDASAYGAHAERGSAAPSTSWFLAEGATGAFSLFYLLQNPGDTAATATVRYLRPAPLAPIQRTYTLPAHSRVTLPVNTQAPELADTDVSAAITATSPILVERSMYRSVGGQAFAAGHASAGVTAAATSWFLAEGATGAFFDLFVLLANPTNTAANVEIRYLLTNGTVLTKTYTVAAESRRTISVDGEMFPGLGQALAAASLSCTITSLNAVPIVVERAMWFPGPEITPQFWTEAHNSPGATATATRWGLADGESGGTRGAQTFVLIANTSATAGRVRITQLLDSAGPLSGAPAPTLTVDLAANSRTTVPLNGGAFDDRAFGVVVESIDTAPLAQLVVERAMYWNAGGVIWTAGTNLLATPLP